MGACVSIKNTNDKNIKNFESKSPKINNELPKLKRRPRLYSESINHPTLDKLNNDNNENKLNNHLIYRKENSIISQRRQSLKYCNEFKNNYQSNNRLLMHLANSLSRNLVEQNNFDNFKPEFIIDWKIVKNEKTNVYMWKNFGKIPLTNDLINQISNLSFEEI